MQDQANVNRRCCVACDNGGDPGQLLRFEIPEPPGWLIAVRDENDEVYTRRPGSDLWTDGQGDQWTWWQLIADGALTQVPVR